MTDNEKLSCLIDRPCTTCKFHKEEGCSKWSCVFEKKSGVPKGEYIKKEDILKELKQNENFFREGFKKYQDINIERAIAYRAVANSYKYLILFIDDLPVYSVPDREKGECRGGMSNE